MRPTRRVSAAFLLAAFVAAGCSKHDEPLQAKAASSDIAKTKPVGTAGGSADAKRSEDVGVPAPAPTMAVPMTFAEGKAAYTAKNYGEATAIFERYTERRPGNAWGQYMLGLSAWKSGDLAKAEGAFDAALKNDPRHIKSLVNLSRVLIEQKRYDDAVEKLTRAADIEPDSIEVHRLLGRTYHAQKKTDEAVEAYRRAIELNELDAWSMNNLGLVFLETQRMEEAVPLFAKAVELRTKEPAFHNNLGMALEHTGRFGEAAAAYQGALTADPGYEKAKRNLTRIEGMNLPR
jgi:tetratricopeptide (TPR) repeat protein